MGPVAAFIWPAGHRRLHPPGSCGWIGRMLVALLGLCLGCTPLIAGPAENAIIDLMRLGEEPSYAWVMTITDDARTYDIEGTTSREGYSRVTMPAVNTVRRKLGLPITDNRVEAIFLGSADCVLSTPLGWLRPDSIPEGAAMADRDSVAAASSAASGKKRDSIFSLPGGPSRPKEPQAFSNLQLAISPPHAELAVMVSSHHDFKVEGDIVSGTFSEVGARLLLVREGQPKVIPVEASGDFTVWLRSRQPIRYQINLRGTLAIVSDKGQFKIPVHQKTYVALSAIGTAKVDVPDEAKIALASRLQ